MSHKLLTYHLRKIYDLFPNYTALDRNDRRIHFRAISTCIDDYERDLENQGVLVNWKEKIELLRYILTELEQYFIAPNDSHLQEEDTHIFARCLELETLELRDLARPS